MGEIIIALGVKDGKVSSKLKNVKATPLDISMSISVLEIILNQQIELFKKMSKMEIEE